ncbi:uncharacterized protein LOC117186842 [Drosophila miranda]|uniref:uncharacterized protein LOC117186842 n=1 Tax=Drosophila miranda TaxID=7229 RepID=UPI00143F2AB9|nr:uncharacterized protein LOC117186842 [Drosophila miranda]
MEDVNIVIYRMVQEEAYSEEMALLRQGSIFQHQLTEIVDNEMRQLYHISGLRAGVRDIAKTCQRCRNKGGLPEATEMGSYHQRGWQSTNCHSQTEVSTNLDHWK